jgi:TatD DNase family protein
MLVETDAPFLAPNSLRGKRNEPGYVKQTAQTIADLHNVSADEIAAATSRNFCRLFNIPVGMGN